MARLHALGLVLLFCTGERATCDADVVGDFAPCLRFFYNSWPPKGLPVTGTPICQRYGDLYRFASLYSRPRRAPWFSAYLYTTPAGKRPTHEWKFEPQLADPNADGNMIPFPFGEQDPKVVASQAVEADYINSTFTRGHLNPSLHHHNHSDRFSTFTLTNVVPQKNWSNDGPWATLEAKVNASLGDYCLGEAYVVTGIIPYQKDEHWLKGHRVAVPEYLWSAYCCPNYNQSLPGKLKETFPTYAAIGRNDPNSTEEMVPVGKASRGYDVRRMPLGTLEGHLRDRFGTVVTVFHEQCSGS